MATLILKNTTGSDILIGDLGFLIPTGVAPANQVTFTSQKHITNIALSKDTKALLTSGDLVANDGTTDLSAALALGLLNDLWSSAGTQNNPTIPRGFICGGRLAWDSSSRVKAGTVSEESLVQSSDNTFGISWTGELTGTMPADLDTGSEAADTWYAVHVIVDSTDVNATKLLFSLSATAPTLPAGYDKFRRVGWVRNGSTSNFFEFVQRGNGTTRSLYYIRTSNNLRVLNNGSATTPTTINLTEFVPPTSLAVLLSAQFETGNGGSGSDDADLRLPGTSTNIRSIQPGVVSNQKTHFREKMPCSSSREIQYSVTDGANNLFTLSVLGYDDEL